MQNLQDSGYRQFYLSFGDSNLRTVDWGDAARSLQGQLRDLVGLFLLQETLERGSVTALLGEELVEEFCSANILCSRKGGLACNDFYLIVSRSFYLLCQMNARPWAYFGDDSIALATLQSPARGGRVLDLCCGPGIQSFVASTHAREVTGVEIRPETWRIAEINSRLNGLEERVSFCNKSAEEFAKADSGEYDLILFNPPLVPTVPGYRYAFVGDGGPDGLVVTRQIVELYHDRVSAEGHMEFIGMGLGRKDRPIVAAELSKLARKNGLQGRIHLLSQHPIRAHCPVFEAYTLSFAVENGLDLDVARSVLVEHFQAAGYDYFWLFFVSLQRAPKRARRNLSTIDLTKSIWGGWFV
ncbi:MAG: methyltransferase domain-containing protein [Verrucomicrobiota bacterium]